jgi:glutamyl endopeptidase
VNNEKLVSISSRTNKPISLDQLKGNRVGSLEEADYRRNSNYENSSKGFTELDAKSFLKISNIKSENQSIFDIVTETDKEIPLDVYFAGSHSHSKDPIFEMDELLDRIGNEDRVLITDTTQFPYRCICKLVITPGPKIQQKIDQKFNRPNSKLIGTGVYVGPNLVLTAAHCVYIHDPILFNDPNEPGEYVKNIEVIPGLNEAISGLITRPFGQTFSDDFVLPDSYKTITNEEARQPYDFAGIITEHALGTEYHIGLITYLDNELDNLSISVCGYSFDKPDHAKGRAQTMDTKKITGQTPTLLIYENDTENGASGSPCLSIFNNRVYTGGIHNVGTKNFNSGTRITDSIRHMIAGWKQLQFHQIHQNS